MKNNLTTICLFLLVLLNSCSKDDENVDNIVGEWIKIEFIQNDEQVDTDICWEFIALKFTENHSVYSERISGAPSECNFGISELHLWTKVGNNRYEISYGNDLISTAEFNNNILIITNRNGYNWVEKYRRS